MPASHSDRVIAELADELERLHRAEGATVVRIGEIAGTLVGLRITAAAARVLGIEQGPAAAHEVLQCSSRQERFGEVAMVVMRASLGLDADYGSATAREDQAILSMPKLPKTASAYATYRRFVFEKLAEYLVPATVYPCGADGIPLVSASTDKGRAASLARTLTLAALAYQWGYGDAAAGGVLIEEALRELPNLTKEVRATAKLSAAPVTIWRVIVTRIAESTSYEQAAQDQNEQYSQYLDPEHLTFLLTPGGTSRVSGKFPDEVMENSLQLFAELAIRADSGEQLD